MVLTARKTKLSFPRRPEEIALEYDLPCIIGKDDISFSRKYDLTPWTENKRWSFSKTTPKYDIFCRCSEKMVFSKNYALCNTFLYYQGRWYFFPEKMTFFFGRKTKDHISQEINGNTIFSVYTCRCYKRGITAFCQKNQRQPSPAKIHLKVIETLNWHPRKS